MRSRLISKPSCMLGLALCTYGSFSYAAPLETFLPPQRIPITSNIVKMLVADVNGDGYDDIIALTGRANAVDIDVYLNQGKPRATSEDVQFVKTSMPLAWHANPDLKAFSSGGDLSVVDIDEDGLPDLLVSNTATGEIAILWNQGHDAVFPFKFVPDATLPTSSSMTFYSPLAVRGFGGDALGTPVYVTAAHLGDATGRKAIIAYHGGLPHDSAGKEKAPYDVRNYEGFGVLYPQAGTTRGFDIVSQRQAWPGCDLSLGTSCMDTHGHAWNDSLPANTVLNNFVESTPAGLSFPDIAADILEPHKAISVAGTMAYQNATARPNTSPGLQLLPQQGPNGTDAIWLQGGGLMNEFVHDAGLKLMRRQTAVPTTEGMERSAGSTFATLSDGSTALITAGGMDVYYKPGDLSSVVKQPVPDHLKRSAQLGAWVSTASFDSGQALLSLADYCRPPDPCMATSDWWHAPLDGSAKKDGYFNSRGLVMLEYTSESGTPGNLRINPVFADPDNANFQAFSITNGAVNHKPFIASGHFASPTELALVMLDHRDGASDPLFYHLALYRPDTAKAYASAVPHLDGLAIGRNIQDGLADIGLSIPQGENSTVLLGSHLGVGTNDPIRYVVVRDETTHAIKDILPVDPPETVKELSKEGIVVPGLRALPIGKYTVEVHNATASASLGIRVVNPAGILATDWDWAASGSCGIVPDTKTGDLYPRQISASVENFEADTLEAVRWTKDDGTVVELPATGYASYNDASKTLTLIVPQGGSLKDGSWKPSVKVNGLWQSLGRSWAVTHDSTTLATCAQQVNMPNEAAYSQCDDGDGGHYYIDPAQYSVWPNRVNGSFRFFGSKFGRSHIKSIALKQGDRRVFSTSLQIVDDGEIHVEFGDLTGVLTPNAPIDLYLYPETQDVVEAEGVPAVGGKKGWRKAMSGRCLQAMPHFSSITGGSGKDGAIQAGDVLTATGENLMVPVPTANRLVLEDQTTGDIYALPPRLPDDYYETHYDNKVGKLLFQIPADDEWESYKIKSGDKVVEGFTAPTFTELTLRAGATAATAESAAGWLAGGAAAGFVGGIYLSGNTPTGVLNFVKGKLFPSGSPKPGVGADDKTDPRQLYVASYLSRDGDIKADYFAVFESTSERAFLGAIQAVERQGRGRYADDAFPGVSGTIRLWPDCDSDRFFEVRACILSIKPVSGDRANGVSVSISQDFWNLAYIPPDGSPPVFPGEAPRSMFSVPRDSASLLPFASREAQFAWLFKNSPPPLNYGWMRTSSKYAYVITNNSTDCTWPMSSTDYCYQTLMDVFY